MDNKVEVDRYQSRLEAIKETMVSQNREAQERIRVDQKEVLETLRCGVRAIQTLAVDLNVLEQPSEAESTVLSNPVCATCRRTLDGLFTECYNCETDDFDSTIPGSTFTCIRCQEHLTCMLEKHCQALRHTSTPEWRLKYPVTGSKRLDKLWVRCTLCGTVLPELNAGFTWCIPCSKTGVGTFCHDCTTKGWSCGQYGHPHPRTTLERVSAGPSSQSKELSAPDVGLITKAEAQTLRISTYFKQLSRSADIQLDTIMEVNLEATELEDKLDSLRLDIDRSVSRMSVIIGSTQKNLVEKNLELEVAQMEKGVLENETAKVDAKLEGNREHRNILRALRVVGWGATVAFPPILPLAAAMEVGNLGLKERRANMKSQKETLQNQCSILEESARHISVEKDRLDSVLTRERTLAFRCDGLTSQLKSSKALLAAQQRDYHLLKAAATHFLTWSSTVECRSRLLTSSTDVEELEGTLRNVLRDLLMCKEKKIAAICKPLDRLVLGSG